MIASGVAKDEFLKRILLGDLLRFMVLCFNSRCGHRFLTLSFYAIPYQLRTRNAKIPARSQVASAHQGEYIKEAGETGARAHLCLTTHPDENASRGVGAPLRLILQPML